MILSTDTHVDAGQLWTYSFSRFHSSNLESIASLRVSKLGSRNSSKLIFASATCRKVERY